MEIVENIINRKIIAGHFPDEVLSPDDDYLPEVCNFVQLAENGVKVLNHCPELMYGLVMIFDKRVKEIASMNRPELFEHEVNLLINTGYWVDDFNAGSKLYSEACKLCSAVTSIDKALWYGILMYYICDESALDDERRSEHRDMMFALIYFLKAVQKKEILYKCTINLKAISAKTNLIRLIEADWDKEDKKYFSNLTEYGIKKLKDVNESLTRLGKEVVDEYVLEKEIADRTETEWQLFLNFFNDLSQREKEVIFQINRSGSSKDKIRIISGYQSALLSIERAEYVINSEKVSLLPLFEAVKERMEKAPVYCTVKTDGNEGFQLHPAVFLLTMDPKTFNYLIITFHEFRLSPGKETAKKFVALALSTIKKNLGEQVVDYVSIDEMIEDFNKTVTGFVERNLNALERLSFESLRKDSAVVATELSSSLDTERLKEDLVIRLSEIENSKGYEEEIEEILTSGGRTLSVDEVTAAFQTEEERVNQLDQEKHACRIIESLNIIYMFCDALRIMINSRQASIIIKNREVIEKYRRELLRIDDRLVHMVYADLGEQEMGMLEYRERRGMIATSLSEQEAEEENYRNSLFGEALKNAISALVECLDKKKSEDVLRTKTCIRQEIMRYPDCDEKERYTAWLDDISRRISDVLVEQCQREDNYQKTKESILSSLGEKAGILPDTTVDSLTTAEILYVRYASEEYAEKGFDFSCISALYYQAFEEAYNVLIWRGYADELNALEINGQKFTDILEICKGQLIYQPEAKGYLASASKQRNFYIENSHANRPGKIVNTRCMYKSFAILLQNIKPSTELDHFCEYIAKITGFRSKTDMFNDSDFMRNCNAFTAAVKASADNRNNASHGGTIISIDQCRIDKKTILSNLEMVRSDSMGLIQQLIYLLTSQDLKLKK